MSHKILIISFFLAINFSFSQNIATEVFATGFSNPVDIQNADDDRLFIVEQDGVIKILNADGSTNVTPFLDINSIVGSVGNEQGLLGLAFDPDYSTNGLFFVNYTNNSGNTIIARYSVSVDPAIADANSAQILLTINQPYSNHNGGCIAFGPEGYLHIGMGDGGSGGDPNNNAQNGNSLLGKMLRIEVGAAATYSIPADNPFISDAGIRDEIWAIGIRNPWRFSFDSLNGDLWIGDVGQNAIEEINHATGASGGGSGMNFGWRCYEGNSTFNTGGCGSSSDYDFPVAQYNQGGTPYKCAVTGGFVYRGSLYPDFNGLYFFADYCSNEIGTIDSNNSYQLTLNGPFNGGISTFGQDVNGELYHAGLFNGTIYKIKSTVVVGVNENLFLNDISISPNPTKNHIIIKSESGDFSFKKIQAFNIIGNKVLDVTVKNKISQRIDLSKLNQGVYFIKVHLDNAETVVKKLIIK